MRPQVFVKGKAVHTARGTGTRWVNDLATCTTSSHLFWYIPFPWIAEYYHQSPILWFGRWEKTQLWWIVRVTQLTGALWLNMNFLPGSIGGRELLTKLRIVVGGRWHGFIPSPGDCVVILAVGFVRISIKCITCLSHRKYHCMCWHTALRDKTARTTAWTWHWGLGGRPSCSLLSALKPAIFKVTQ